MCNWNTRNTNVGEKKRIGRYHDWNIGLKLIKTKLRKLRGQTNNNQHEYKVNDTKANIIKSPKSHAKEKKSYRRLQKDLLVHWNKNIFEVWGEKKPFTYKFTEAKILLKNESKYKTFFQVFKVRQFITSKTRLKEILKEALYIKGKPYQMDTWICTQEW